MFVLKCKANGPVQKTEKGYIRSYLVQGTNRLEVVKIFSKDAAKLPDGDVAIDCNVKDNFFFAV